MSDAKAVLEGLSSPMKDGVRSMEWTGEYYIPPAHFRTLLAQKGILDAQFGYAVTTLGEQVRALIEEQKV